MKKYVVELTEDEHQRLHKLISAGSAPARMLNRARILLKADVSKHSEGGTLLDREIAPMLETSMATVQRVREHFCGQGLEAALERSASDRAYRRSFEGSGGPPDRSGLLGGTGGEGALWSMRLLADKAVEMGIVQGVSHETISIALKNAAPPPRKGLGDRARTYSSSAFLPHLPSPSTTTSQRVSVDVTRIA